MNHSQVTPEIATLLAANPEAAHFLATLAGGTPLADAVRDHFGALLTADDTAADASAAPEVTDAPESTVSQQSAESSTATPGREASETPVPFAPAADGDEVPDAPTFLAYRRRSFWPDDFTL